ncbi:unnamed protein product [Orchesella dallaii]|uniref:Ig-like domain-containing protein n=1 Tax=Orchesella dallaii TaxID=48710 RepID=A0ABP1S2J4_9HEXA
MEGKLSTKVLALFLLIASYTAAEEESGIQVIGRLGSDPTSVILAPQGKNVELICDLGELADSFKEKNSTKWSFTPKIGLALPDLALYCEHEHDDDDKDKKQHNLPGTNETLPDCEVSFKRNETNNHLLFILELEEITDHTFGKYECHTENPGKVNHSFIVEEIVTLTRRYKGKIQRSWTIIHGDPLELYCNATGLSRWHEISWLINGTDITDDLNGRLGLFENFTKTDDLTYFGDSLMEHRGNYTCRVDLKDQTNETHLPELRMHYPVEFSVYIRVQEQGRWKLPVYILIGEAALILLFTIIVNIREKRYKEGEADGDYEDSDDEDEAEVSKNGVMNNNSSSS